MAEVSFGEWLKRRRSALGLTQEQLALQLNCSTSALRKMEANGLSTVEVRADVQERFNATVQRRMHGTVWTDGGCASWYLDAHGRNPTLWPDFTWRFRRRTRRFDPAHYVLTPAATRGRAT